MALIKEVRGKTPLIPNSCFIASNASLIGDVKLGEKVSIWFQAIVRGDVMPIEIGDESNIQDAVVIHGTYQKAATKIGRRVSVGHGVILHGCEVKDSSLIGMGAVLMDGSQVGERCLIGARTLITENMKIPDGHLAVGSPAKVIRPLNEKELAFVDRSADNYLLYQSWYQEPPQPETGK